MKHYVPIALAVCALDELERDYRAGRISRDEDLDRKCDIEKRSSIRQHPPLPSEISRGSALALGAPRGGLR